MKTCETCKREWPEGFEHPGIFARFPEEPHPDDDDLDALVNEQSRLTSYARVVFHGIYCAWREANEELEWDDLTALTGLGQALCWEIGRYERRLIAAAVHQRDQPAKRTRGCGEGRA